MRQSKALPNLKTVVLNMVNEKRIQSTVPILASLDIQATIRFYVDMLGFVLLNEYPDYMLLERDGCEIHFWSCNEKHIAENTACYVRVREIEKLSDEYIGRGVKMLHPLETKSWGMKEFAVIDVSGNLLRFGERPEVR